MVRWVLRQLWKFLVHAALRTGWVLAIWFWLLPRHTAWLSLMAVACLPVHHWAEETGRTKLRGLVGWAMLIPGGVMLVLLKRRLVEKWLSEWPALPQELIGWAGGALWAVAVITCAEAVASHTAESLLMAYNSAREPYLPPEEE